MKSKILTLFAVVLLSTITVGVAHAATDEMVKANIPFNFYAGNYMMPAGTYSVGFDSVNNVAIIRDNADHHEVFLLGMSSNQGTDTPKLVFDHLGNSYFLRDRSRNELVARTCLETASRSSGTLCTPADYVLAPLFGTPSRPAPRLPKSDIKIDSNYLPPFLRRRKTAFVAKGWGSRQNDPSRMYTHQRDWELFFFNPRGPRLCPASNLPRAAKT